MLLPRYDGSSSGLSLSKEEPSASLLLTSLLLVSLSKDISAVLSSPSFVVLEFFDRSSHSSPSRSGFWLMSSPIQIDSSGENSPNQDLVNLSSASLFDSLSLMEEEALARVHRARISREGDA
ncbi:unnamed protein product [Arabis nemorensis]|uniref:Uncharacterized protein n=1 Tax=Arabis nemorensis TaxID=586526 RepID=A0A565C474_9BRAS|nr:unnamed protein product [Arabis nemorensis]